MLCWYLDKSWPSNNDNLGRRAVGAGGWVDVWVDGEGNFPSGTSRVYIHIPPERLSCSIAIKASAWSGGWMSSLIRFCSTTKVDKIFFYRRLSDNNSSSSQLDAIHVDWGKGRSTRLGRGDRSAFSVLVIQFNTKRWMDVYTETSLGARWSAGQIAQCGSNERYYMNITLRSDSIVGISIFKIRREMQMQLLLSSKKNVDYIHRV